MGRERKNQLGTSNLSARIENSSLGSSSTIKTNDISTNNPPSPSSFTKVTKSLTRSLIAPDDYVDPNKKTKRVSVNKTATWKPAAIYERDFSTDHTSSFTDPKRYVEPLAPAKSTYEIAEEQLQVKAQKGALDDLCKLIRTTYGTAATMMRSFNKKNSDNFNLNEFNQYIQRNQLETYLPEEKQRLVFDYISKQHHGEVPVKDFLRTVEEHEFRDHEISKETQKIRDFLAFRLDQKRAEEEVIKSSATLPPIDEELAAAMKRKGVENEAEKIRKALGMRTFDLDVDHKEFNDVLDEVYFKKLPTNEMHRKYARFLHHSNLKLSQVPYYDIRSEELERLKHRAAMIDRILEGADMNGRYLELSRTRSDLLNHRVNNAFLLSSNAEDLRKGVDVNNYDFDKYDDPEEFTSSVPREEVRRENGNGRGSSAEKGGDERDSNLQNTATKFLSRPLTASAVSHEGENVAVNPSAASSPAERFQESRNKANDRLGLSKSLPNLQLSARPSPLAALDVTNPSPLNSTSLQKSRDAEDRTKTARDLSGAKMKKKGKRITGGDFEEASILSSSQNHGVFLSSPLEKQKTGLVAAIAVEQGDAASQKSYDSSVAATTNHSVITSKQGSSVASTSPSHKKSKLISELLQPQEGALKETDFYTHVYDEASSMGRLKDPSKVVRIEKIDPKVYATTTGKRIASKAPTDWSRVGIGGGSSLNEQINDQFTTTSSHYFPPLVYEPSQPVSRDLVSEADLEYRRKAYIRNQRYLRTQANIEITRQRIEAEQLEKQMRSLRREASRIEDSIRYKTSVMLNDLYAFKQQPLQRMAKRQNIHLSDRMWGGSQEKQTVVLVSDNRDFHTTYSASFLQQPSPDRSVEREAGEERQ